MDSFIHYLFDGLSLGVIYALLAVGYSLAGCAGRSLVFANSAAGLFGVAVSLLMLSASAALGVRFEFVAVLIAFTTSVAAASACGWVIGANTNILAPRQRGLLPLLIATSLVIIAAAALNFTNHLPVTNYLRPSPTSYLVFGIPGLFQASIALEKAVIILAGAALFAIVLPLIRRTRFGRECHAVSQGRGMAELFGVDVNRIDLLIVLTSFAVAAGAGSLMVLDGGAVDVSSSLLTVASAFAAAVVAGLQSIRRAAGAGFVAGAATAMWSDLFSPAFAASAIFAILLFLLAFSPSRGGTRGIAEEIRMPRDIAVRDLPQYETSFPSYWRTGVCLLCLSLACSIPAFAPQLSGFGSTVLLYVLLATGLSLELHLGGLPDFAFVSWFAIGAYSDALIARYSGLPFWACVPLVIFLAAFIAVSIASPLLRRPIEQFGMLTLGVAITTQSVLAHWTPSPALAFPAIPTDLEYWSLVAATVAAALLSGCIRHSSLARVLRAARHDEIACHSIGVDIRSCRSAILLIGAATAGAAGSVIAAGQGPLLSGDFDISLTAVLFAIAALGGRHGQLGIIVVAIALAAILQLFPAASEYRLLIAGAALFCGAIWRAIPKSYVPQAVHSAEPLAAAEIGAE